MLAAPITRINTSKCIVSIVLSIPSLCKTKGTQDKGFYEVSYLPFTKKLFHDGVSLCTCLLICMRVIFIIVLD